MEAHIDDAGGVRPSPFADFYSTIIRNQGQLAGIHFRCGHVCMSCFNAHASPSF